ncbi:hypothetical protein BC828DRAFT_391661 [Blastocladiella britannica]|nr:hypothetical protein BC828DRAFT_391661 [Blastocladiella britannica]
MASVANSAWKGLMLSAFLGIRLLSLHHAKKLPMATEIRCAPSKYLYALLPTILSEKTTMPRSPTNPSLNQPANMLVKKIKCRRQEKMHKTK